MTVKRPGRGWETLLALIAAVAAGGAGGYLIASRNESTAAPPSTHEPVTKITSLGRLQPAGGVVPIFGPPGDRIAKLYPLDPGQELQAGEKIAELASRVDRLQELEISKTQSKEAITSLELAKLAGEKKILSAEAELNQAQANRASDLEALNVKKTYAALQSKAAAKQVDRLTRLRKDGVKIPDEELDKVELIQAQADAEVAGADATIKKTMTTYTEMEKAAKAKVEAAKAELKESLARIPIQSTEAKIKLAEQLLDNTIIKAPVAGTVLRVIGREGVPTGLEPIVQIADLSKMTVIAEVYESDIKLLREWVRKGSVNAVVHSPALPNELKGTIQSEGEINRMIARNQVYAMGPREDIDRRVVEVVINISDADTKAASAFVGLQVNVTLEPAGGKK